MRWLAKSAAALILWLMLLPGVIVAQTDPAQETDAGFLTRMIEENLSSVGRTVIINGFEGALSSTATIRSMTIADAEGVWLQAEGLRLNWNRTALLRGRIDIREMTAEQITLFRPPVPDETGPTPEATPFSLPELPVSINIGQIKAERIVLGDAFLGEEVALTLQGSASLSGNGTGNVNITAERLDGVQGEFSLIGAYSNATRTLSIVLDLDEAEGGILATALDLPGTPAVSMQLSGTGPIDDYSATLLLATDGVVRITGEAGLVSVASTDPAVSAQTFEFRLNVRGDVTTLIAPEYQEFFGSNVSLALQGSRDGDGRLSLSMLDIRAKSLDLRGTAAFAPDGWPQTLQLTGEIAAADGTPVVLPGTAASVRTMTLDVAYDVANGNGWTGDFLLTDLQTTAALVPRLVLTGGGVIVPADVDRAGRFTANLTYGAEGLALTDPALATAVGDTIDGEIRLSREADGPFQIARLTLQGPGIEAEAEGTIAGPAAGFLTQSSVMLRADDLARFAPLTGLDLGGEAELVIISSVKPLDRMFDIILNGNTRDLAFGNDALDPLLRGESLISVTASRDAEGARIDGLSITSTTFRADGSVRLTSGASDAVFDLVIADVGVALPDLTGPATLRGTATRDAVGAITVEVKADLPGATAAINAAIATPESGGTITGSVLAEVVDLAPFSPLLGRPVNGQIDVIVAGTVAADASTFDVGITGRTQDVVVGIAQVDALLTGSGQISGRAIRTGFDTLRVDGLSISTDAMLATGRVTLTDGAGDADLDIRLTDVAPFLPGLSGPATIKGTAARDLAGLVTLDLDATGPGTTATVAGTVGAPEQGYAFTGQVQAAIANLAPFAALAGQTVRGGLRVNANGTLRPDLTQIDVVIDGETQDLKTGIAALDPLVAGTGTVDAQIIRAAPGSLTVRDLRLVTPLASMTGGVNVVDGVGGGDLDLRIADIAPIAPGFSGPASLTGTGARDAAGGISFDVTGTGAGATASAVGTITSQAQGAVTQTRIALDVPNLAAFSQITGRRLGGAFNGTIDGTILPEMNIFELAVDARATNLDVGVPVAATLLRGAGTVNGRISLGVDKRLRIDGLALRFPNLTVNADLSHNGNNGQARFDARLADVGLLARDFNGPATVVGTATLDATGNWQAQVDGTGPGGTTAAVRGTVQSGMRSVNLTATGTVPLGLVNGIIEPNRIDGMAAFDLRVQGPPALQSVSGTLRIDGARAALPSLRIALPGLGGTARIAGGRATLDITGNVEGGGRLSVAGDVGLAGGFPADLRVTAAQVVLRDATLYESVADGVLTVTGPLAGGAQVAGVIDLGLTEIQVPTSGVGVLGDLPEVRHIAPSATVLETLARAGLTAEGGIAGRQSTAPATVYGLDVTVRAPARVFVRGRGLDAELGGEINIGGTTAQPIPRGEFRLIRGRVSILGQRFELSDGTFSLQGDFIPNVNFTARTEARTGTIIDIIIEGPVTRPDVTFRSIPDLPQDEVLAQLIFGVDLASVSPLQAIQLASAVATLAGRGGSGMIEGFRQGSGLDDFDIVTDDEGNAAVRAGRYLTEDIYTDVTVGSGESEINLNFDVTRDLTIKGSVNNDGATTVGIYFERDY